MIPGTKLGVVIATCACLAGCAGSGVAPVRPSDATPISALNARDGVVIGKTKAEVLSAFGKTTAVSFDSGFEVWVYQIKADAPAAGHAEFVLLFAPSGIVTKTRTRPSPIPGG